MGKMKQKSLTSSELRGLQEFGERAIKFGINFFVWDRCQDMILCFEGGEFRSDADRSKCFCSSVFESDGEAGIFDSGDGLSGVKLHVSEHEFYVAIIDVGEEINENDSRLFSAMKGMLFLYAEKFNSASKFRAQIEHISTELSSSYEELMLLHKLSSNMKVTEPDINFLQIACDSLTNILAVEGIAILLEKKIGEDNRLIISAGSGIIDFNEYESTVLCSRLVSEINSGQEALLDSDAYSAFKYDWPENIKSIIAVPLLGKSKSNNQRVESSSGSNNLTGILVAVNVLGKPDFNSPDVKLFNSVANSCAVFVENGKLFDDLKELFVGSLKSLTSSIDAKDEYTRGHSERVAFISRWIAERLVVKGHLDEDKVSNIYLAGLLHDIGKLGINESVLLKNGRLSDEEFNAIKKHPSIGAGILRGIKQMKDIVPGVLCHHERVDGKGYPNGLGANQIPLIGKIISVADSFDAMTSKRSYRDAMTVEQALAEIRKGICSQFDETVARVFLDSDVYHLCGIIQNDCAKDYDGSDFSNYGTIAVGALIR